MARETTESGSAGKAKKRRMWTAEQKLQVIEEGRQGGTSVSEVCRRREITAGQFYEWERQAKRGALAGLKQGNHRMKGDEEVAKQQQEIERLREVIVELSTENLALKKGRWR